MKRILFLLPFLFLLEAVNAQVKIPSSSPICKLEQEVGLMEVKVEYSRPGLKNRRIFGDLVPFDEMWHTGANANTIVSFGQDVQILGETLEKGEYALYTIPGELEWEVIFYANTENWGLPRNYDETLEALRVTVESDEILHTIETFTINIDNIRDASATLDLYWENTVVQIPFEVDTDNEVLASIKETFAGPERGDYYAAARYFYANDKDLDQALTWIQKANDMDAKYWQLRLESLILAKLGDTDKAIAVAKRSLAGAQRAGNKNYILMNRKSIAEWTQSEEVFERPPDPDQ